MNYKYFYGEMEVELDKRGRIRGFGFWCEKDDDRWLTVSLVTDYRARTGLFKDNYSGERYSRGKAHTVVLHHDAGMRTYTGISAWAIDKYHRFLKYLARAQCHNFLNDWATRQYHKQESSIAAEIREKIEYLCENIEIMQRETHEVLIEKEELYTMIWLLPGVWEEDEQKKKLCWLLFQKLEKKWRLSLLRPLFQKLL